jgi:hypothetical protein
MRRQCAGIPRHRCIIIRSGTNAIIPPGRFCARETTAFPEDPAAARRNPIDSPGLVGRKAVAPPLVQRSQRLSVMEMKA